MKFAITTIITFFSLALANSQSLEYRFDSTGGYKDFYLYETVTGAISAENPKPTITITPQHFTDTTGVRKLIADLRDQAQKYDQTAKVLSYKAAEIEKMANANSWFMSGNAKTKPEDKPGIVKKQ